ncbi:MAG TPA: glucose-6-phosphate dehydrogenase assembly protein OpcA [Gaiellaceae bacterium]|nr:glucose-6-phosphate dehydrogenase assembly protein OpcA [Gaiellaceae bacterium]
MAASVGEIERELAELREEAPEGGAWLRTSVLTHVAWAPPEWREAAEDALAGLAERHPSRTILLVPEPDADEDALAAAVDLRCFSAPGQEHHVCSEVIEVRLRGRRAVAPASVVAPLLLVDLPAFLRWRGEPPWGDGAFDGLVDLVDRLIVDSTEWEGELPPRYAELARLFDRVAVSDVAWARTTRWRTALASMWPGIGGVRRLRVTATPAQAHLLAGWLRSRLGRDDLELEIEPAEKLVGVEVDGEPAPFPPGDPPHPSDVLSDELDRFGRDRVYEDAVRAVR